MKKVLLAASVALTFIGCASVGQDFNMADVDSLQPGISTLEQAKEKLGKPQSVGKYGDDRTTVTWIRSQASIGSASSKAVAILFDRDGKMIRVVSRNETKTN